MADCWDDVCQVCDSGGELLMCFCCNIAAHGECVPDLSDMLESSGEARMWTATGADEACLVCPACWVENSAALLNDGTAEEAE